MNEIKNNELVTKKSLLDEILDQPYKVPFINIFETEHDFVLTADMPGVSKNNLELKLEDNHLTIIGKVDVEAESKRKYLLREKQAGNYLRRFKISDSIEIEKIDAKLENGQLSITLPKKESIKPRNIEIV
jgi:HSP20 family protein